jgi:hypothetical protein
MKRKPIPRLDREYEELSYDPETGIQEIIGPTGLRGKKWLSYVALKASKDGKIVFDRLERRYQDEIMEAVNVWQHDLAPHELIFIYQAENYEFVGHERESDMALIDIVPDPGIYFRIEKGLWTDRSTPQYMA